MVVVVVGVVLAVVSQVARSRSESRYDSLSAYAFVASNAGPRQLAEAESGYIAEHWRTGVSCSSKLG